MAKKKAEDKLTYMQMPLPGGKKSYKISKRNWTGLNYRHTVDSGALSMMKNISTLEAPALVPASLPVDLEYTSYYDNPLGMFAFGDVLLVLDRGDTVGSTINVTHFLATYDSDGTTHIQRRDSGYDRPKDVDKYLPGCVVQFNAYDTPTDPVSGKYVKKLLIFPDKMSMDLNIKNDGFEINTIDVSVKTFTPADDTKVTPPDTASHGYYYFNTKNKKTYKWVDDPSDSSKSGWTECVAPSMPNIKYATVHASRLFGVDDGRVYASGFNDYANWNLDTIDEYGEGNAWCSTAQSNTKADSAFTGITNFQGHVVCFKRNFMHEIYNTKNPFRVQDIFAEGTIDHRTIQDVDGKLIFVTDDDVKIYTGSNPRSIGYNLNLPKCSYATSGTDGRCYYLYYEYYTKEYTPERRLFVYDTITEAWSERAVDGRIMSFAYWINKMFILVHNRTDACWELRSLSEEDYDHNWSFETDLITSETVNIKHIKKMQMLADFDHGASMSVYFLYDDESFDSLGYDEKKARLVYSYTHTGLTRAKKSIRVKPRKTANYGIKLHVEGYGYVKLYELELFMENGGGLYV